MTAHSMSQANPLNSLDAAHEMEDLIATSLNPIEPDPAMDSALSARLFQRVARSAQANAPFVNVRKRDGVWTESVPGVQVKLLHEGEGVVSRLIQLAPGAHWSLDAVAAADEILILSGDLDLGGIQMAAHDYHLRGAEAGGLDAVSAQGAVLYWRQSASGMSAFGDAQSSVTVSANDGVWAPLRQGVMIKPLFGVGDRVSMLARLEVGGSVPAHVHECAEECLMLDGDMFLGDVLLLQGEYQWAPGGTGHDMLLSDVGCVVFIHGAVDPALKQAV